jgi:uncharacterized protein DUF559
MPRISVPEGLRAGPFTTAQGRAAGLGAKRMRGPDLHAPFRGIRTTEPAESINELAAAFQLGSTDNTFFCNVTAALILRMPLPQRLEQSPLLHVAVRAPYRAPRAHGTVGHKLQVDGDEVRDWSGLRITTPERTWCDLASFLSVADLVAAGDYLIHWELPHASQGSLLAAVEKWTGRRGKVNLRQAVSLLSDRSESRQESLLRVLVVTAGIDAEANLPIVTSGGFRYRGDLVLREKKVIIEYQSRFHDGSKSFRADMTRISRLEADGWRVIQVNKDDLDNPRELVQRIRTVLRAASG